MRIAYTIPFEYKRAWIGSGVESLKWRGDGFFLFGFFFLSDYNNIIIYMYVYKKKIKKKY